MWALRDEKYCKNDFWVEVLQKICTNAYPIDQISPEILDKVRDTYIKKTYSFDIKKNQLMFILLLADLLFTRWKMFLITKDFMKGHKQLI